jgi:uncharacterized membrane protein (UPF0127 family)
MATHNLGNIKRSLGIIGLMFAVRTDIPYYIPLPAFEKNIHTFFMAFAIDILFIDQYNCVIDKTTLAPRKNYIPKNKKFAVGAIEDIAGKFKDIQIGDFVTYTKI